MPIKNIIPSVDIYIKGLFFLNKIATDSYEDIKVSK